jgi:hypothetical protein
VRAQLTRTKDAALGLARAHLALLRAEIGEILDEVKMIAGLAGVILVIALFAVQLVAIGGTLFLGEWLFGSIGWGVLDGLLLSIALIVAAAMAIIEAPRRVTLGPFAIALVLGMIVSLALGANLARRGAVNAADHLRAGSSVTLDPTWAPDLLGAIVGAIVVGIILLIVVGRVAGGGWAFGGLVLGAVVGAVIGWWVAGIAFSWQGAVAVGLTFGLLAWIALMPIWMLASDVDPTARFRRLYPRQSIDAANETKTWLENEWAKRRARLGRT